MPYIILSYSNMKYPPILCQLNVHYLSLLLAVRPDHLTHAHLKRRKSISVFYKIRNQGYSSPTWAVMAERDELLEKIPAPSLRHLTAKDYGRLRDSQREVVSLLLVSRARPSFESRRVCLVRLASCMHNSIATVS